MGASQHRLGGIDQRLVRNRKHGHAADLEHATDLIERRSRIREMLENLRAIHALEGGGPERQFDRICLGERGLVPETPAGPLEQHPGKVHAEPSTSWNPSQEMAGTTADLEDPMTSLRRQERPDTSDPRALDPANEDTWVIVETIEVVSGDHRVVPGLSVGTITERTAGHDHYAIPVGAPGPKITSMVPGRVGAGWAPAHPRP